MNILTPHIITEGNISYELGKLSGNQILYDFEKILCYLEAKGKLLFGKRFKIYDEDRDVLFKLSNYMINDYSNCEKLRIDTKKGILLSGPELCGKTSLMKLVNCIVPHRRPFEVVHTRNISFAFSHTGYKTIEHFGNNNFYCFDGLGKEPIGRFFGTNCNVIGEILHSRFDLFLDHKVKTHAITNLTARELEDCYGSQVRYKMRQLFNLVAFDKNTTVKGVSN